MVIKYLDTNLGYICFNLIKRIMKNRPYILLVAIFMVFVTVTHAQLKTYPIKNGISVHGGITLFDIVTDNFATTRSNGWMGGMAATVDLPHKWYTVSYGMQLSENVLEISGRMTDDVAGSEALEYKLMTVQLSFLFHAKIIGGNLTIDAGPQLQYNGKLELNNSNQEDYFINNYDSLGAKDIEEVSQFNANGVIGVSAGRGSVRLRAHYIYGVTNILNKLNDRNLETGGNVQKFEGNQSMLAFTVMFTL